LACRSPLAEPWCPGSFCRRERVLLREIAGYFLNNEPGQPCDKLFCKMPHSSGVELKNIILIIILSMPTNIGSIR
jgi:hypothetical protein